MDAHFNLLLALYNLLSDLVAGMLDQDDAPPVHVYPVDIYRHDPDDNTPPVMVIDVKRVIDDVEHLFQVNISIVSVEVVQMVDLTVYYHLNELVPHLDMPPHLPQYDRQLDIGFHGSFSAGLLINQLNLLHQELVPPVHLFEPAPHDV